MKILCIDNSSGKLFFVQELLWMLNSFKEQVYLDLNKNSREQYRSFLTHFKNISLKENNKKESADLIIDIIDHSDKFSGKNIIYPVIPNDQAAQYEKITQDYASKELFTLLKKSDQYTTFLTGDVEWLRDIINKKSIYNDLDKRKILISAGPTMERIDPVRYLTNHSTGKMGIALARAAYIRGANVTLVVGPTNEYVPSYLNIIRVESADEMANEIINNFKRTDVYIGAAAIADFTPLIVQHDKIKKNNGKFPPKFRKTIDILSALNKIKMNQYLIGFSVETENMYENSMKKLKQKNLEFIVANNPKEDGAAFAGDTNRATIIYRSGKREPLPLISKTELSNIILDKIVKLFNSSV